MKTRRTKDLELTKENIIPLIKRKPVFEQPTLQLPMPSEFTEAAYEDKLKNEKEKTERGIWTIDI